MECLVIGQDACIEMADGNHPINEIMMGRIKETMSLGRGVFGKGG